MQLVVGLGNPGRKYAETRHNVGFMVVDELARKYGVEFKPELRWKSEVAKLPGTNIWLVKPLTFMNLSGEAIGALARFRKLDAASVLLVYDDMDLELGRLRIRRKGSAGGHNGVKSAIQHLGTDAIPRVKFGIGRHIAGREQTRVVGHVLGKFSPDERSELEFSLTRAIDAILCACNSGVIEAMNAYNASPTDSQ
ncbi:aminoacyl-tRNA hydrolase [Sulfuriroseicoccus oceanibius]|uniref:Peptidyl-tRNA hydrolase n=1 Tax=Sulfuriroseicoccus oceanibius TaxID=2707525 RepID=A0A7T7F460_9BACT|nr:aminoacyl-tRNA hydrolase [Sulfuriroseicoccus oceanibius]